VEGLLGFYTSVMRQFYDVKVYLNPPEDLRTVWKVKRDTSKRGYTPEQVLAELVKREPDSRDFHPPAAQARRHRRAILPAARRAARRGRLRRSTCA
jgi:phosphoribulokinase